MRTYPITDTVYIVWHVSSSYDMFSFCYSKNWLRFMHFTFQKFAISNLWENSHSIHHCTSSLLVPLMRVSVINYHLNVWHSKHEHVHVTDVQQYLCLQYNNLILSDQNMQECEQSNFSVHSCALLYIVKLTSSTIPSPSSIHMYMIINAEMA